jgi:hypothetical protein
MKQALILAATAASLLASPAGADEGDWVIVPDTSLKRLIYVGIPIVSTDALMWPDGRSALIVYLVEETPRTDGVRLGTRILWRCIDWYNASFQSDSSTCSQLVSNFD